MKISMIIVMVSLGCVSATCRSSFDPLNETTLACPGLSLVLECSTERQGSSTVFEGSLLNCSNTNNEIALLHSGFNKSMGTNGTCNDGAIVGYSLPLNTLSSCYTSQLHIMVTPDMIGKTVKCVYDSGTTAKVIGNHSIEGTQCYTMTVTTTHSITTSASVQTVVTTVYENSTGTSAYIHHKAIKSLSTKEVTAIVLGCSVFLVGIMITVIIVLTFGFILKKKQLKVIQTPNSAHVIQDESTSTTLNANLRHQTQATFHCAQDDGVSGYALCTTDYNLTVVVNDDSEYSHLQHPGPQHTPGMKPRAHLQLTYT